MKPASEEEGRKGRIKRRGYVKDAEEKNQGKKT